MSLWDTSALVKLYAMETDSAQFQGLTAPGVPLVIARIAHYEAHAVFRRRSDRLPRTADRLTSRA